MGTIRYDSTIIEFEDRLLSHLHIVIINKLRRDEPFVMSWLDALSAGDGRSSIWVDRGFPIYFKFNGSRPPQINADWIAQLAQSASSSSGLIVTREDGVLARSAGADQRYF